MFSLTKHFMRRSNPHDRMTHAFSALTTLLGTVAFLVLAGIYLGAGNRFERVGWRQPHAAAQGPIIQNLTTHFIGSEPVTVVTLAAEPGSDRLPTPPGVDHFPAAGEVWLSPALKARLASDAAFEQRLPLLAGAISHELGRDGLAAPSELVAVVGASVNDEMFSRSAVEGLASGGLFAQERVADFAGTGPALGMNDASIAAIGVVLLAVPILVLVAASGRLGARRREGRLSRLRLAGASPRQALQVAAIEAAITSVAGAVAGVACYVAATPVLARFRYGIGTWYATDLLVGPFSLLGIAAATATIGVVSAASATRRSIFAPLATAIGAEPESTTRKRAWLALAIAAAAAFTVLEASSGGGGQAVAILLVYGVFWVIGVFVIDRIGRSVAKRARKPATLLAARRLADDPRGAWRCISGLVLTGFIVGMFTVGRIGIVGFDFPRQLAVVTTDPTAVAATEQALASNGLSATVRLVGASDDSVLFGTPGVVVDLSTTGDLDPAAQALATTFPGQAVVTERHVNAWSDHDNAVVGRIGLIMLLLSTIIAAASTGLAAAAAVLDRRDVYARLRFAGMPMATIDRARAIEALAPAMILTAFTVGSGILVASKFHPDGLAGTLDRSDIITLVGFGAACVALIGMAVLASSPLLRTVATRQE